MLPLLHQMELNGSSHHESLAYAGYKNAAFKSSEFVVVQVN